jgi:hypothetical protein
MSYCNGVWMALVRVTDSRVSHKSCFSYGRQQLSTVRFITLNRYRWNSVKAVAYNADHVSWNSVQREPWMKLNVRLYCDTVWCFDSKECLAKVCAVKEPVLLQQDCRCHLMCQNPESSLWLRHVSVVLYIYDIPLSAIPSYMSVSLIIYLLSHVIYLLA